MKRSIVVFAALAALLVFVSTAVAGEATPSTATPSTDTPTTTTDAPVTTDVPVTTAVPVTTETPTTTTDVPVTTDVPATTTDVPVTTDLPMTTSPECAECSEPPCTVDCIPASNDLTCTGIECIPAAGGGIPTNVRAGAALPFTGIGDVIAPLLLALTIMLGGVVAWRWAQLRESVAAAASRARQTPIQQFSRTGYAGASRQLEIEHRARRVFAARVA